MKTAELIADRVARRLGRDVADVDRDATFDALGLDSAAAVELSGELEAACGRPLPATLLYEHPTINALAAELDGAGDFASARPTSRTRASTHADAVAEPLAVVGIGCRLPGRVSGPDALWRLLRDGVDATGPVPDGRWTAEETAHGTPTRGGFLEDVWAFDAAAFGISAREAGAMDPQQRVLLEVVAEALDDAMVSADALAASNTGVFVGISGTDWSHLTLGAEVDVDRYATTGSALSIAANRVSYAFDLQGASLAVDTACSSSLVALDLARRAVQSGESDMAIVGGVNVLLRPQVSVALERASMLSHDGRCRSFAQAADGYGRGEGAGVVVLKPLSAARADEDRIYAVLRGTAVGSDGRTNGLTAPSGRGQRQVLTAAYRNAGLAPSEVGFVEGQGTGTPLGDAIEAEALGAVLGPGRALDQPCALASVKTNMGHLEAAAGIVAFAKAALAIHHGVIPASLYADDPRDDIPFELLGLHLQTETAAWPVGSARIAGVSGFGFGGTNAHAVLTGA